MDLYLYISLLLASLSNPYIILMLILLMKIQVRASRYGTSNNHEHALGKAYKSKGITTLVFSSFFIFYDSRLFYLSLCVMQARSSRYIPAASSLLDLSPHGSHSCGTVPRWLHLVTFAAN